LRPEGRVMEESFMVSPYAGMIRIRFRRSAVV
jgi:hypothetical protein